MVVVVMVMVVDCGGRRRHRERGESSMPQATDSKSLTSCRVTESVDERESVWEG